MFLVQFMYPNEIRKVEVEKETTHCVWIDGQRCDKVTIDEIMVENFEKAKALLVKKKRQQMESQKRAFKDAQQALNKALLYTVDDVKTGNF